MGGAHDGPHRRIIVDSRTVARAGLRGARGLERRMSMVYNTLCTHHARSSSEFKFSHPSIESLASSVRVAYRSLRGSSSNDSSIWRRKFNSYLARRKARMTIELGGGYNFLFHRITRKYSFSYFINPDSNIYV